MRGPDMRGAARRVLYALSRRVQAADGGRSGSDTRPVPMIRYGGVDEEDPATLDGPQPVWPENAPPCTCGHADLKPASHSGGCVRVSWRPVYAPPATPSPDYSSWVQSIEPSDDPGYVIVKITTPSGRKFAYQVPAEPSS